MSSGKQRTLGYESQKSILQELGFDIRRRFGQICPKIRTLNKTVPYKFDEVKLEHGGFHFDNLKLFPCCSEEKILDSLLWSEEEVHREFLRTIELQKVAFLQQSLKKYLRPGTFIRKLVVYQQRVSLSNYGPLNVEYLKCYGSVDYPILKDIISIIDKKCILFTLDLEVNQSSLKILDEPVVRNAECLVFTFDGELTDEISNKFMDLPNESLMPQFHLFSVEQIYEIGKRWISTNQEVGKELIMPTREYTFLCDVIDYFKQKFPESYMSKVIFLENSWFANSLSIPINEDTVLVVYGGERVNKRMDWTVRMEIMLKEDVRPQIVD